jgi:2-oxoglutarate ferredoxin oxidoreductase subunit alpha
MQFTGTQFTNTSAAFGNDVSTMPDFPAEIRAPAGTLAGVSGFQVNISSHDVFTPGDAPQVLVCMNPAALKTNLGDLEPLGTLIVNSDEFVPANLRKAGYDANPLEDGSLAGYRVIQVPLTTLNRHALEGLEGLGNKDKDRSKNCFALGLIFWMYGRSLDNTVRWMEAKFGKTPQVLEANLRALRAGHNFGETTEDFRTRYRVPKASLPPGRYRKVTGNEATALGLVTAASLAGKSLFYASYPITPASSILEELAALKHFDVRTVQAEDEISAMGAVIGASFGGALAATATSGPGICLKSEGINLAVVLELPMVICDVQRGGPSTGLPTKVEQTDLLQVLFGRNGESPIPVVAPATPSDCFDCMLEAWRLAIRGMTPVIFLSDAYLANSSEPWRIPDPDLLEPLVVTHRTDPEGFAPYQRDEETLARPWALPGTPGLEHRIGGLGKQDVTGAVSYTPEDHSRIVRLRVEKIARLADALDPLTLNGPDEGDLLVLGWGSTYGALRQAVERVRGGGGSVSHLHLRHLNPFPADLGELLARFRQILLPELNLGQLALLLRARYPVHRRLHSMTKVEGRPFRAAEVESQIRQLLTRRSSQEALHVR